MNIGIVGSRRRNTSEDFVKLIDVICSFDSMDNVAFVSGGCPEGGDLFAEVLAQELNVPIIIHYPDKKELERLLNMYEKPFRGAYAKVNYARNTLIARDSDILIALVASDRTGGTEDTIKKFLKKLTITEQQAIMNKRLYLV
jgi:cephalosporin-C deacetylase-like acetyl esterase